MKKTLLLPLLITLFCAFSAQTFAFQITKEGNPYTEKFQGKNISWQPVKYEDNGCGFLAAFPGDPKQGISTPWFFVYSENESGFFEINVDINTRYTLPKTAEEFNNAIKGMLNANETMTPIKISSPAVKYAVEITVKNEKKVVIKKVRVYLTTAGRLFRSIVECQNLAIAPVFFDKISFY